MIYLFTALYCEARIFIRQFHLEKDSGNALFQGFYNEAAGIRLTITGVGEIAAAAAVGGVCSVYRPKGEDMLLNVGLCAHMAGGDGIYVCNKITEQATGRAFYPDMLYRHDFREEAIVTGMLPWKGRGDGAGQPGAVCDGKLYDMEAAAVYQAGSCFFGPHQMIFLKIVSDGGAAEGVSERQALHLMETNGERLIGYIGQIQAVHGGRSPENPLRREEEALAERLGADMHCSRAMQDEVRRFVRYLSLTGTAYMPVIQDMYDKGLLPCKDKREGKLRFEEFKGRLL